MDIPDAIRILDLQSYSHPRDLKSAFRAIAHRTHPDKNKAPDAAESFRRLIEAYQLCEGRLEELSRHFGTRYDPAAATEAGTVVTNIDDIFEDIFGFSRQGRIFGYRSPEDLRLAPEEFARGGERRARFTVYLACAACGGSGAGKGSVSRICRHCFGSGLRDDADGVCRRCGGRGREMKNPCGVCSGYGRVGRRLRRILQIPAGLVPGEVYTLSAPDPVGGESGQVVIRPAPARGGRFQIENSDLVCEYVLNAEVSEIPRHVTIETPFSRVEVALPQKPHPGDRIRVRGEGLRRSGRDAGARGDLVLVLRERPESFWSRLGRRLGGRIGVKV